MIQILLEFTSRIDIQSDLEAYPSAIGFVSSTKMQAYYHGASILCQVEERDGSFGWLQRISSALNWLVP